MAGTAPSSSDCIAYYKMEDLTDSTSNDYDMINNGATGGSTGILDDCYFFSLDDMATGVVPDDVLTDEVSISVWVKVSTHVDYAGVVYARSSGRTLGIDIFPDGMANGFVQTSTGNKRPNTDVSIEDGDWHHLVLTYDGSDAKMYLDGGLDDTIAGGDLLPPTSQWYLGRDTNSTAWKLKGYIDEVGLFDVALTADNVTYLYNSGSPGSLQQYPFSSTPVTVTDNAIFMGCAF